VAVAHSLYRAAEAAGDDPARYSFAFVKTDEALAHCAEDATVYFSDGLVQLPHHVVEPVIAHEVAHEVLGHVGTRRALSLSVSAGFMALGFVFPGVGLMDFIVNPLIVRAFTREQELAADRKAVDILRAMGYETPRRALAEALRSVDHAKGSPATPALVSTHPALGTRLRALEPLEPRRALAAGTDAIVTR
jgi:Zn-dependent protease with chaperone function